MQLVDSRNHNAIWWYVSQIRIKLIFSKEVSLAQLAMGVDVQPRHLGSNPRGCEFGFLLFI
jgi:hypothetical protein